MLPAMSTASGATATLALLALVAACNAAPETAIPSAPAPSTPAPPAPATVALPPPSASTDAGLGALATDDAGAVGPAATTAGTGWKACPRGTTFACQQRSSGIPLRPGEGVVCGCMHGCPRFKVQVVQPVAGTWPDGSAKGAMVCTDSAPPSTRPWVPEPR
jgi:hypothetical protein